MAFERKMLRKIFGPVLEDNQWRIKKNTELENLFKDANFGTVHLLNSDALDGWEVYVGWVM